MENQINLSTDPSWRLQEIPPTRWAKILIGLGLINYATAAIISGLMLIAAIAGNSGGYDKALAIQVPLICTFIGITMSVVHWLAYNSINKVRKVATERSVTRK